MLTEATLATRTRPPPDQEHREGGTLLLRSQDQPDAQGRAGVLLEVCDSGAGLSAPVQAQLFCPFFTTQTRVTGWACGSAWSWWNATAATSTAPTGANAGKRARAPSSASGCCANRWRRRLAPTGSEGDSESNAPTRNDTFNPEPSQTRHPHRYWLVSRFATKTIFQCTVRP